MMKATENQAVAVTTVFWDIQKCPVPPGCDARQVGPCIKRLLKDSGYSGPLTIYAIGVLTDVPHDVLRAISSAGIVLYNVPFESKSLVSNLSCWGIRNRPPANIMVISDLKILADILGNLQYERGFNVLHPFPYEATSTNAEGLLKCFLLPGAESGALEEDECRETGESAASWFCQVCLCKGGKELAGQGFENFTTHLSSQKHAQQVLRWFPSKIRLQPVPPEEAEFEALFDCPPNWKYTTALMTGTSSPMKIRYLGSARSLTEENQDRLAAFEDEDKVYVPRCSNPGSATLTMMWNLRPMNFRHMRDIVPARPEEGWVAGVEAPLNEQQKEETE